MIKYGWICEHLADSPVLGRPVPGVEGLVRDVDLNRLVTRLLLDFRGAFRQRDEKRHGIQGTDAQAAKRKTDLGDRAIAFTFDDGPDPVTTPLVLDLLARHGAHATFFVVGSRAAQHPELLRRMLDEGHAIATHVRDRIRTDVAEVGDVLVHVEPTGLGSPGATR